MEFFILSLIGLCIIPFLLREKEELLSEEIFDQKFRLQVETFIEKSRKYKSSLNSRNSTPLEKACLKDDMLLAGLLLSKLYYAKYGDQKEFFLVCSDIVEVQGRISQRNPPKMKDPLDGYHSCDF